MFGEPSKMCIQVRNIKGVSYMSVHVHVQPNKNRKKKVLVMS